MTLLNTTITQTGSTFTRTVGEKLLEQWSVKDFGAIGDGIANDGPAIKKAIDAVSAVNGELFFPDGVYAVKTFSSGTSGVSCFLTGSLKIVANLASIVCETPTHASVLLNINSDGNDLEVHGLKLNCKNFAVQALRVEESNKTKKCSIKITDCSFLNCFTPLLSGQTPYSGGGVSGIVESTGLNLYGKWERVIVDRCFIKDISRQLGAGVFGNSGSCGITCQSAATACSLGQLAINPLTAVFTTTIDHGLEPGDYVGLRTNGTFPVGLYPETGTGSSISLPVTFNSTTSEITCTNHNLSERQTIVFAPTAGSTLPLGIYARGITSEVPIQSIASTTSGAEFTSTNHNLANGDAITLKTTGGFPAPFNTTTTYFVVGVNLAIAPTKFKLSLTSGGSAINLTNTTQTGEHSFSFTPSASKSYVIVSKDLTTNTFKIANAQEYPPLGFVGNGSGTTNITATVTKKYYVIKDGHGSKTFKLSFTREGPPISLTGTATSQYQFVCYKPPKDVTVSNCYIENVTSNEIPGFRIPSGSPVPIQSIASTASGAEFTTSTNHNLANGNSLTLKTTGGLPAPFNTTTRYFVVGVSSTAPTKFKLSLISGGSAINLTSTEQTGNHSFWLDSSNSANVDCDGIKIFGWNGDRTDSKYQLSRATIYGNHFVNCRVRDIKIQNEQSIIQNNSSYMNTLPGAFGGVRYNCQIGSGLIKNNTFHYDLTIDGKSSFLEEGLPSTVPADVTALLQNKGEGSCISLYDGNDVNREVAITVEGNLVINNVPPEKGVLQQFLGFASSIAFANTINSTPTFQYSPKNKFVTVCDNKIVGQGELGVFAEITGRLNGGIPQTGKLHITFADNMIQKLKNAFTVTNGNGDFDNVKIHCHGNINASGNPVNHFVSSYAGGTPSAYRFDGLNSASYSGFNNLNINKPSSRADATSVVARINKLCDQEQSIGGIALTTSIGSLANGGNTAQFPLLGFSAGAGKIVMITTDLNNGAAILHVGNNSITTFLAQSNFAIKALNTDADVSSKINVWVQSGLIHVKNLSSSNPIKVNLFVFG